MPRQVTPPRIHLASDGAANEVHRRLERLESLPDEVRFLLITGAADHLGERLRAMVADTWSLRAAWCASEPLEALSRVLGARGTDGIAHLQAMRLWRQSRPPDQTMLLLVGGLDQLLISRESGPQASRLLQALWQLAATNRDLVVVVQAPWPLPEWAHRLVVDPVLDTPLLALLGSAWHHLDLVGAPGDDDSIEAMDATEPDLITEPTSPELERSLARHHARRQQEELEKRREQARRRKRRQSFAMGALGLGAVVLSGWWLGWRMPLDTPSARVEFTTEGPVPVDTLSADRASLLPHSFLVHRRGLFGQWEAVEAVDNRGRCTPPLASLGTWGLPLPASATDVLGNLEECRYQLERTATGEVGSWSATDAAGRPVWNLRYFPGSQAELRGPDTSALVKHVRLTRDDAGNINEIHYWDEQERQTPNSDGAFALSLRHDASHRPVEIRWLGRAVDHQTPQHNRYGYAMATLTHSEGTNRNGDYVDSVLVFRDEGGVETPTVGYAWPLGGFALGGIGCKSVRRRTLLDSGTTVWSCENGDTGLVTSDGGWARAESAIGADGRHHLRWLDAEGKAVEGPGSMGLMVSGQPSPSGG